METRDHQTIDVPGALGVDRRAEVTELSALACRQLRNFDLLALPGSAARLMTRRALRRWGEASLPLSLALGSSTGLTGGYIYAYIFDDGVERRSVIRYILAADQKVEVSGWSTAGGTCTIYRTAAWTSGDPIALKLCHGPFDVTITGGGYDAGTGVFTDTVADGALGAAMPAVDPTVSPMGNTAFDQTAICDLLLAFRASGELDRVLSALVRTDAAGGNMLYVGFPDQDEYMGPTTQVSAALSMDEPVSAAVLGGLLWFARGGNSLAYRDVDSLTGGVSAATQPAAPTISFGAHPAGTLSAATGHQYAGQYEHKQTGIRSNGSNILNTGPYAGPRANRINFPSSTNTRRWLYRTTDGGRIFQLVGEVTSTPYDDDLADTGLGLERLPTLVGAAGGFKYVEAHKGLLFVFHQTSDPVNSALLRWTAGEWPYNFVANPLLGADYEFKIDEDDGDEGTGLKSWGEVLIAFKRRGVYMVTGDPPTAFRWTRIGGSEQLGCIAHRTIVETDMGLGWLSPSGPVLMRTAGEAPLAVGDRIRDVFVEPERFTGEASPAIVWEHTHLPATSPSVHVRVQLDGASDFSSIDFDWITSDAGERPLFRANHDDFPAGGFTLAPGRVVALALIPPEAAAGGPAADTTWHVRYSVDGGGTWTVLPTWRYSSAVRSEDAIDYDTAPWAFSLYYAGRQEWWLFIPTGGRRWCDSAWVASLGNADESGPRWRQVRVAASAGCVLEKFVLDGRPGADYLLIAGADGLLYTYPDPGPWDYDTRLGATVLPDADRRATLTLSGATLSGFTGTWTTTGHGLKGNVLVATDGDGRLWTGLIVGNTGNTLTVTWLGGQTPADGTLECWIGGLEVYLESGWLSFGGDPAHTAIVREMVVHAVETQRAILQAAWEAGRQPARDPAQRVARALPVGGDFPLMRWQLDLRGHYHRLTLGSSDPRRSWEIRQVELAIEPTGARE